MGEEQILHNLVQFDRTFGSLATRAESMMILSAGWIADGFDGVERKWRVDCGETLLVRRQVCVTVNWAKMREVSSAESIQCALLRERAHASLRVWSALHVCRNC